MKIIIFEGTPEEYAATFSGADIDAPVICDLQQRKRGGKPWVSVIAELDDGGVKKYRSVAAAYEWYKRASNHNRTYRNYAAFRNALKTTSIRFADVIMSVSQTGDLKKEKNCGMLIHA